MMQGEDVGVPKQRNVCCVRAASHFNYSFSVVAGGGYVLLDFYP